MPMPAREHLALVCAAVLVAGCGGGGGSGDGASAATPTPPPENVAVRGRITFDLVPAVQGVGLAYDRVVASPAREVVVELISAEDGVTPFDAAVTDADGRYTMTAPSSTEVFVRVHAQMQRSGAPSWDFQVFDNTNSDAPYVLDGTPFDSGVADVTRNLRAASGWNGASYGGPRAAAPFAILDVIYDAVQVVLGADPGAAFPVLRVHWSPGNVPEYPASGVPDPSTGEIGTSFFSSANGIFLLGAENVDTDEYDRSVIAHEFGHYLEQAFFRSDSIGGPHSPSDQLDMRVAFSEGWGNAGAAIMTGDRVYKDVQGIAQRAVYSFDTEGAGTGVNAGWYNERSVHEIIYDLFDGVNDDALSLGFAPLYQVLTHQIRDTSALTSLFPFLAGLESDRPNDKPLIDALVSPQNVSPVADDYGSGEAHSGNPPAGDDVLPVYADLGLGSPQPSICSTDDYTSPLSGSVNKLGSRRYLKLNVPVAGVYTFDATATTVPAGEKADPDMVLHRRGTALVVSEGAPGTACTAATPTNCSERFTTTLDAGDYVLEVYEWTNTQSHDGSSPPIGRTCFNVEMTSP
jgi:hypothetical protein